MTKDLTRHLLAKKPKMMDPIVAREQWVKFRKDRGYSGYAPLLTAPGNNVKLAKSKDDAAIYGLSLAPAKLSEKWQVCRYRSKTCEANCVAYAGNGELPNVSLARVAKTEFLGSNPDAFITLLVQEIQEAYIKEDKLAVRLNTFSDLPWEELVPWMFGYQSLKWVQFYDYTKWTDRTPPKNYHLTYSASERTTDAHVAELVQAGQNVAVVFSPSRFKELPKKWNGLKVIDGDKTDARYKDKDGIVVGLRAKGRMRKNPGGMVRVV